MGLPYNDVRIIFGIFDNLPPVIVTNQLILFLSSAFLGPPPPTTADVIYMEAPQSTREMWHTDTES